MCLMVWLHFLYLPSSKVLLSFRSAPFLDQENTIKNKENTIKNKKTKVIFVLDLCFMGIECNEILLACTKYTWDFTL